MAETHDKIAGAAINEQVFFNTFNSLAIGLALVSPEGKYIDVNPALCKIVGYSRSELQSLTFQKITHPDDLNNGLENLKKINDNESDSYHSEKRYIHKNENIIYVDISVSAVRDIDNKVQFFITQAQDITERKLVDSQLNEQNAHLTTLSLYLTQQNNKLEEFNQIVSHNLRTPAGNIKLLLKLFNEEDVAEEKDELMQQLILSSDNLINILNDLVNLLEVKNLKNISKQHILFQDVFDRIKPMLAASIRDQKIKIEVDFSVSEIFYSRVYLESIIINLLSNAIKYCSPKRKLKIVVRTYMQAENLILEVSDNGLGIDLAKHNSQIFKLNQTFHDNPDSKGLGLYMVKHHIESLGGSINVKSKVDVGTTFRVDFGKYFESNI